jgi:hypothetical protein
VTARRKKRLALLLLLVGLYGAFFSLVVFSIGRDGAPHRSGGSREQDATAQEISCSPNWFVLGAVSRCRATVVKPDGTRYSFSSFANELSSDDVGHEVAMTEYRQRGGKPVGRFSSSRVYPVNVLGMLFGFFGSIVLAVVPPLVLWPRKPRQAPTPLSDVDRLARVAKLRKRSWILVGVGLVALYVPYATYGFFIDPRAVKEAQAHQPVEGSGEVTGCSRDWTYLGQLWSCDLTIAVEQKNVFLSPDRKALSFPVTLHSSRFTPDDVGRSFPMTALPTANPFGHGQVWERPDREVVPSAAMLVAIFGLFGGLVLVSWAQTDRRNARKLERDVTAPPAVEA